MAYTTTSSIDVSKTAYDQLAYYALRPQTLYDALCDVEPTRQSMPGASCVFTIFNDLAPATTPLNESTDITQVAISDSTVTLTLVEYGNGVITTSKLRATSFIDTEPIMGDIIGYNAGVSIDSIVRGVVAGGSNVWYSAGQGATATQIATAQSNGRGSLSNSAALPTVLSSADILTMRAKLRANNVMPFGSMYGCVIHPSAAYDLMNETGVTGWRIPHDYSDPSAIWAGELGSFQSFRFIESPRAPVFGGVSGGQFSGAGYSGSGTNTVFATLCLGRQAIAKGYSVVDGNSAYPHIVDSPVTDALRRFVGWGWYWPGAYGIFRQASLWRIESAATLGDIDPTTGTDVDED
jgi:N4-gp56 family major capsid protein